MNTTHDIGIVMAGAISAGAYSGGAMDFLLAALEEYYALKKRYGNECTLPDVKIKVIAGASAGGMTASMALSAMTNSNTVYQPITNPTITLDTPDELLSSKNVFYRSWVSRHEGIDFSYMLDNGDIQGYGALNSLLNCERIEEIATREVAAAGAEYSKGYLGNSLHVLMTTTNISGIPYYIDFRASEDKYGMRTHADVLHFEIGNTFSDENYTLDTEKQNVSNWKLFAQATMATGAFPVALASREIRRSSYQEFDKWKWWVPDQNIPCTNNSHASNCKQYVKTEIKPSWNTAQTEAFTTAGHYSYMAIDGGVINNEPLDLVERILHENPQSNSLQSIIMIDPFPEEITMELDEERLNGSLLHTISKLKGILLSQSRFKPESLRFVNQDSARRHFMIAPMRKNTADGEGHIASSVLFAFGGFLSEKFRRHDFQLGRRNAQQFLKQHFTFPVTAMSKECRQFYIDRGWIKPENAVAPVIPIDVHSDLYKTIEAIPYDTELMLTEAEFNVIKNKIHQRIIAILGRIPQMEDAVHFISKKWYFRTLASLYFGTFHTTAAIRSKLKHLIADFLLKKVDSTMRAQLKNSHLMR